MGNKRVGVVLAGCGVFDGAEIQEAVAALLNAPAPPSPIVCPYPAF